MSDSSRHERFKQANRLDGVCDRFEAAWNAGERPRIEDFLRDAADSERPQLLRDLLAAELSLLTGIGQGAEEESYCQRFPGLQAVVRDVFHSSAGRRAQRLSQISGVSKLSQGSSDRVLSELKETIAPGREFGSYELMSLLGEGGMGQVWKARHTRLEKLVALKVLSPRVTGSSDSLARFDREMKAVGRLEHPHIVRALDAGEIDGTHFLVLEYIEGLDLAQYVAKKGKRPLREACEMIRQAALGLNHAHEAGLVHRDIKPSNLFFARTGSIKVLDLGLARLLDESEGRSVSDEGLTEVGQIMGTPDYMAPEQCQSSHSVDLRADLYSLGCTLFCVLTGRAPYADGQHNTPVAKVVGHMSEPAPDLKAERSDVPDDLVAVYQRLMQKDPEDRFQSGKELADALKSVKENLKRSSHVMDDDESDGTTGQSDGSASAALKSTVIQSPAEVVTVDEAGIPLADVPGGSESEPRGTETQSLGNDATLAKAGQAVEAEFGTQVARDSLPSIEIASATDLRAASAAKQEPRNKWLLVGSGAAFLLVLAIVAGVLSRPGSKVESDGEVTEVGGSTAEPDKGESEFKGSGSFLAGADDESAVVPLVRGEKLEEPEDDPPEPGVEVGSAILHPPEGRELPVPGKNVPLPEGVSNPVMVQPGEPLHELATVPRPAAIEGIRSWSIEPTMGPGGGEWRMAGSLTTDIVATVNALDPFVRLWDRTGRLKQLLPSGTAARDIRFSPDGRLIAVGEQGKSQVIHGGQGRLRVWDVDSGARLFDEPFAAWVYNFAFSPDSQSIVVPMGIELVVIDLQSGRRRRFKASTGQNVCLTPDGAVTVAIRRDAGDWSLRTLNVSDGTSTDEVQLPAPTHDEEGLVRSFAWSPDGKQLALLRHGEILLLDPELNVSRTIETETSGQHRVEWHSDSRRLLAAGGNGDVAWKVYDTSTGEVVATNEAETSSQGAVWTSGGAEVVSLNSGRLERFDAESGKLLWVSKRSGVNRGPEELFVSDDSVLVADDTRIWRFNVSTGELLDGPGFVTAGRTRFSPDGLQYVRFLANPNGFLVGPTSDIDAANENGVATPDRPLSVAWSADSGRVAAATADNVVRIYRLAGGKEERSFSGHGDEIVTLEWSPDEKLLASLSLDQTVRIWNANSGEAHRILTVSDFPPPMNQWNEQEGVRLAWTPDSRGLWIATNTCIARFDVETGALSAAEEFSMGNVVTELSMSPDGSQLLTRESYGWTILRGADVLQRRLIGQSWGRRKVWHPDSRRFLSCTHGRVLTWDTEWNVRLGTLISRLDGTPEEDWLCVGPDGHYRGSKDVASHIVYVAELENGATLTCSPAEFAERFGWKNDPDKARLLALDPATDQPSEQQALAAWQPARIGQTRAETLMPVVLARVRRDADAATDDALGSTTVPAVAVNIPKVSIPPVDVNLRPGQPISSRALVSKPAPIRGLKSWSVELASHYTSSTNRIEFSPNGTRLATRGRYDSTVKIWRLSQTPDERISIGLERVLPGNAGAIEDLDWSPDGQTLATISHQKVITLFDAGTGRLLKQIPPSQGPFQDFVKWSPDGRRLASSGPCLIDPVSGAVVAPDTPIRCFQGAWSPSGRELVTLTETADGTSLTRWNGVTLQHQGDVQIQPGNQGRGNGRLVWSDDGARILHTERGDEVSVVKQNLSSVTTLRAHGQIYGIDVIPDAEGAAHRHRVATAGAWTQVWDAESGDLLLDVPLGS
jgi:serine/threonine protein kinase/WD40 repeat protein